MGEYIPEPVPLVQLVQARAGFEQQGGAMGAMYPSGGRSVPFLGQR